MGAVLKILTPGLQTTIQDKGRFGYASIGVPRSGAADLVSLMIGNALVGNGPFDAAIEFRYAGPKIIVAKSIVRLGLAGDIQATVTIGASQETKKLSSWQTITLNEGDTLNAIGLNSGATGYITIEGGIDVKPALGSSSTYARAKLGGLRGENLKTGDLINTRKLSTVTGVEKIVSKPLPTAKGPLRVILGPQDDYFSDHAVHKFSTEKYKVSTDADRMGIRLEGPEVISLPEKGNDLISDGLIPGAIQIPGNGLPIILFMDCQSVGGYPKIATIISADLHRLGQIMPGDDIQFSPIDIAQAQFILSAQEIAIQTSIASIQDYFGEGAVNLKALYQSNLVSGMVDAINPGQIEEK